jgi:hypothetical protein
MQIEIKISGPTPNGKKTSIKRIFDSLDDAKEFIDYCIFAKTRQQLRIWRMRGCPNEY